MDISAINSLTVSGQTTVKKNEQFGDLNKADFLKLITAQLKYQDPLSPVNNFDFMSQATQFNVLEQIINLNSRLDYLTQLYNLDYANNFLGKNIEWEDENGNVFSNVIEKIEKKDGAIWLYADGKYIAPSWVKSIKINEP